ncbi:hypothetical protein HGA88_04645 [Candidatus Roizmanbacteria bacterium]|nr:hypothetical protein [Candidatus Roizmanbacteria bacterium]
MNIVISAHFDLARPVMSIKLDNQQLSGLVDNFAGVFAAYQISRKTGTPVYFTNFEELEYDGAIDVATSLDKENTIVIVLDTILEKDAQGKAATITNAYGIETEKLKEKFADNIHFIDGFFEEKEDETWIYGHQFGFKTFYIGIPIPNDYHTTDNHVSLEAIDTIVHLLENLINELK